MIPNALVHELQVEFLKRIALLIERGKIDLVTGKVWAKELVSLLPFTSLDDLKEKVQGFATKYPLLENLPFTITKFEENLKVAQTAEQMTTLIKSEKHDEALSLTQ
jgi:hypothetical protein